jgi:hypothetical protein
MYIFAILICFFLLYAISIRLILLFKTMSNKITGEDEYQLTKKLKTKNSYIYSYCIYNDTDIDGIKIIIEKLFLIFDKYVDFYKLNFTAKVFFEKDINIEKLLNSTNDDIHNDIFVIYYDKNIICLKLDHAYLGTSFFHECGNVMYNGKKNYLELPKGFPYLDISILKFMKYFFYKKLLQYDDYKPIEKSNNLKRFFYSFDNSIDYYQIKPRKINKSIIIIHKVLSDILKKTNRPRIKTYLTYGFKHTHKLFNNVGIIFLDFDNKMSIYDLDNYISNNKFQVLSTNYFMQIFNNGTNVRNSVDVVFSMGYILTDDNNINDIGFTFGSIPDYPIYVCSISLNNKTYISITTNTNEYVSQN